MRPYDRIGTVLCLAAGPAALAVGLAAASVAAAWSGVRSGPVPALTMFLVVVPAVLLLARRLPGGLVEVLALRRPAMALTGVAITVGSAAVVFAVDALLGGTRVLAVDPAALVVFLLVTGGLVLLQEVVPEELALRGHTVSVLRRRHGIAVTTAASTLAFIVAMVAGSGLGSVATGLLGLTDGTLRVAPEGQHPLDYVILLALFGVLLALLRLVTGSLWAAMAGHMSFLLVSRVLVVPQADTGVAVDVPPDAELLAPIYLVLASSVLVGVHLSRRTRRRLPSS